VVTPGAVDVLDHGDDVQVRSARGGAVGGATGSSTAREASARVLLKLAVAAPPSLRRVPYYPASLQTVAPTQNDCWWVKP
jgi:hypothetical protein